MLRSLGYPVTFYGCEDSEVVCDEFVPCLSVAERTACYGDYDWHHEFFKHDGHDPAYTSFNLKAAAEIAKRKTPQDVILVTMGNYQQFVANAHPDLMAVESGIGYSGVFAKYRVFESYAWMHYIYGLTHQENGSWYDAVIPNYFDLNEYPFQTTKQDYFVYVGRLVSRKGLEVAAQVTERLGAELRIAGQGTPDNDIEGLCLSKYNHIAFLGTVGVPERADLVGHARAAFVPTYYIEPFGGAAVEAQLMGTPVLTTDWGAFSETVLHGVTGYRCRTFDEFVWAARHADALDPTCIRAWAAANYSLSRVARMYGDYFKRLSDLWHAGWYEEHPERTTLDGLRRFYPPVLR